MDKEFFQEAPEIRNQYTTDVLLTRYLKLKLPADIFKQAEAHLTEVGEACVEELLQLSKEAEANPPVHIPFDAWGKRIDLIKTSDAWKQIENFASSNGLIAAGYERRFHEFSRLYQMSLLYLFHPSSAFVSCPLAMTDGAARAIELYGDDSLKNKAFKNLTSRDPKTFWTSGQWMTEKTGGSDVSTSSTIAKKSGLHYELYGTKWFTSATNAQMAMTLARIEGSAEGSKGLSLFYVELRDKDNNLNKIRIHRLKDKLGTRALPTAELNLEGTPAQLVGGEGHGVKKIASLFNITRVYNSVCALAQMRRALTLADDYSHKRMAFGKSLYDHPLHQETMSQLWTDYASSFHLVMFLAELLGKDETGKASEDERNLLRMLTPVAKLYTGKMALGICSEVVEVFGGVGYVEDSGIAVLLRDAQVFPIWEGTTNVLSLDMLRAIEKENALSSFQKIFDQKMKELMMGAKNSPLRTALEKLNLEQAALIGDFRNLAAKPDMMQRNARHLAFRVAKIFSSLLMIDFAEKTKDQIDFHAAAKFNGIFYG